MQRTDRFLYQPPYLMKAKDVDPSVIWDYLDESAKSEETRLQAVLVNMATNYQLIVQDKDVIRGQTSTDKGTFLWTFNNVSLRAMVRDDVRQEVLRSLQFDDDRWLNAFIDIHTTLGCLFETPLLNSLVDRTMRTITAIPFPKPGNMSWEEIHKQEPYFWIVVYLQAMIRGLGKPYV